MKKEISTLVSKSVEELREALNKSRAELTEMNIQHSIGQLKDHTLMNKKKKHIAHILTLINQKQAKV